MHKDVAAHFEQQSAADVAFRNPTPSGTKSPPIKSPAMKLDGSQPPPEATGSGNDSAAKGRKWLSFLSSTEPAAAIFLANAECSFDVTVANRAVVFVHCAACSNVPTSYIGVMIRSTDLSSVAIATVPFATSAASCFPMNFPLGIS